MTPELSIDVAVIEERPIPGPGSVGAVESLVRHGLTYEGRTGDWEVAVALISDDELRRLHREFMGLDTVTDVMTFPLGGDERGGDIAISVERAAEQAPDFGMTAWEEVRFLVVHGVLHLCGWDDRDEGSKREMLARQMEIVESWDGAQVAGSSRR